MTARTKKMPLSLEVTMTEKHNWYKAALRRKKIAEAKRLKADRYIDEMNKRANEQHTSSNIRHSS